MRLAGVAKRLGGPPRGAREWLASPRGLLLTPVLVGLLHVILTWLLFSAAELLRDEIGAWQSLVSDLWQVEASVLGLTFVVAVLLIQTRGQDSSSGDLFRLYIQESGVVPVAVAGLSTVCLAGIVRLALVQFSWSALWLRALTLASMAWFVAFIGLNVYIYWQTVSFMNPSSVSHMRMRLLERAIDCAVAQAAEVIVAGGLFRRVCEESGLQWSLVGDSRRELEPIRASKTGRVIDIDLARIESFAGRLRQTVAVASQAGKPHKALLLRELGSVLSPGQDVLGRVQAGDLSADAIKDLRDAYKLSSTTDAPSNPLLSVLNSLKDEAGTNLRGNRVGSFEQALGVYLHVFERILSVWHAVGLPLEVSSTPLGHLGRSPLSTMTSDVFDILRWALQTHDPDVIGTAMYLPIRMAKVALQFNEVGLHRTCTEMMVGAYRLVAADQQHRARGFVIDRSWRYIQELGVSLIPELQSDATSDDHLRELARYFILSVAVSNKLLKAAMDYQDVPSFKAFGTALDDVLWGLNIERIEPRADALEWELKDSTLPQEQREEKERALNRYRILDDAKQEVELTTQLAWFGISAWLLRQMRGGKISWSDGSAMLAFARGHFSNLGTLSTLYFRIRSERVSRLDWDGWVLAELPEREAHWIDTESWMRSFYCLQGLRLTPKDIGQQGTPIVPDRQLEHEFTSLEDTCRKLCDSVASLRDVVAETDLERLDNFLELHRRAVSLAQRQYEKWLVCQPVSQARRDHFREELLGVWPRGAAIRAMLVAFAGTVEHLVAGAPESAVSCGINRLVRKAIFVEDGYVLYDGFGAQYGQEFVWQEDAFLLSRMTSGLQERLECDIDHLADCVDNARRVLGENGYEPDVLIMDREFALAQTQVLRGGGRRSRTEQKFGHLPTYVGNLCGLPVCAPGPLGFRGALVADLSALGYLIQYREAESDSDLQFELDTVDEAKAAQLLDGSPHLQSELKAETREDAIWRLQQLVHLRVTQHLSYQISDATAGVLIYILNAEGNHAQRSP